MKKTRSSSSSEKPLADLHSPAPYVLFSFKNNLQPYFILAVLGFLLNINTVLNQFALDDGIIIHRNEYVIEGVKGIDSIMSRDAYHSFYKQMNAKDQLAGGRYRPLSVVTFALEQEIIGTIPGGRVDNMVWDENHNGKKDLGEDVNNDGLNDENDFYIKGCAARHFNNVWLYVLSCLILFAVLKNFLFPLRPDLAFMAALLFLVHPIHTEVIANIKSRDEIMSMLFVGLTFYYAFRYYQFETYKPAKLWVESLPKSGKGFLFAVFSGLAMALLFLSKNGSGKVKFTLFALLAFLGYRAYRYFIQDKRASKFSLFILTALSYACALLSKEYAVTLIVLVPLGLYIFTPAKWKKSGTQLFFMLGVLAFFYICIRMSIVVAKPDVPNEEVLNNPYLFANPVQKMATKIFVLLKYLMLLIFPHPLSSDYSYNTIAFRSFSSWDTLLSILVYLSLGASSVWLFFKKHPLSFAILFYLAHLAMIGNILFDIGATMGERLIYHSSFGFCIAAAYFMYSLFVKTKEGKTEAPLKAVAIGIVSLLTLGMGYKTISRNAEWKSDETLFITDVNTVPNSVMVLGNAGARYIDMAERPENKNVRPELLRKGIAYLSHSLELHPRYVNGYLNVGLAHLRLGNDEEAEKAWREVKRLYPSNPYLAAYLPMLSASYMNKVSKYGKEGKMKEAIDLLKRLTELMPEDPETWYNLGGATFMSGNYKDAVTYFSNCLKRKPDHALALNGLQSAQTQLKITEGTPAK